MVPPIKPSEGKASVCVVIPSLHRPDLLERCCKSLSRQTFPPEEFEVIIVENAARRDEPVPQLPPKLRVRRILQATNLGTTGSVNCAVLRSDSRYVLLLNNDIDVEPAFLEILVRVLENSQDVSFATAKLLNATERARLDGAGDAMLLGGGAYRLGHQDIDHGQFDRETPVLAGCGAALLIRRSLFEKLGGLDEVFFAYLDDVDLCLRAQSVGSGGVYVPQAVGYHIGSATLGDRSHPQIVRWMTRNQIFLVLKNYPFPLVFRLLPRIVVYQMLWCMLSLKRGAFYSYLLGLGDSVFSLLPTLRKRRAVMRNRKISNREFLGLLRQSEGQVYDWHMQQPEQTRSTLLKIYFGLFAAQSTYAAS